MANIQTLESKTLFSGYASLIPGVTAHHCFRESGQRFLWPDLHITKPGVSTGLVWNGEVHSSGSSLSYLILLMLFTCSQHPLQLSVRDIHGVIQQLSSSEWCRHPAECTPIIIEMTSLSVHHSLSLCLPAKLLNNGNHFNSCYSARRHFARVWQWKKYNLPPFPQCPLLSKGEPCRLLMYSTNYGLEGFPQNYWLMDNVSLTPFLRWILTWFISIFTHCRVE